MKIIITAPFAKQQVDALRTQHQVVFLPQDDSAPLRSEALLHTLLEEEAAEVFITDLTVSPLRSLRG